MNDDDDVLLAWLNARGYGVGELIDNPGDRLCWPGHAWTTRKLRHTDLCKWVSKAVYSESIRSVRLRDADDESAAHELRDVVREWMLGL